MSTHRRRPLAAVAAIGVGLVAAPVAFSMFERAPKGAELLDGFAPYMDIDEIDSFRGHLAEIGAARDDVAAALEPGGTDLPATRAFAARWDEIHRDMGSMLDDMEANLDEFDGVAALPSFTLFPWFFVLPGLLLVATAAWALRRPDGRGPLVAAGILGVGLLAAPVAFQMFTRAPGGARMIDDFAPMMTEDRILSVQGYFLTIGSAEGELRRTLLPAVPPGSHPAVEALVANWPATSADMAPLIGAVVDNLDNYRAVAALPPFGLFPWFFVAPGVLVVALAAAAAGRRRTEPRPGTEPVVARHLEGIAP